MRMKAGLTFVCMNLKKLAKILDVRERRNKKSGFFLSFIKNMGVGILTKRVVLELGFSTNFVYGLKEAVCRFLLFLRVTRFGHCRFKGSSILETAFSSSHPGS